MNLEQLYQPITVDLWNPYPLPKMHVQQNNIGRVALVTLTAGGTVVDPSSYSVTAWATKPDMTVSYAMCEVTNGKVALGFTSQMLAVPGELKVEIRLIADGVDISTPIFIVCVGKSNISNSAIESQNEFTVFQQVLNEVNQLSKEIANLGGGTYSSVEPATDDIPKVFFDGDTTDMSKNNEKVLKISYRSLTTSFDGWVKMKWQGTSSIHFAKKNYTIKIYEDEALETKKKVNMKGWGEQNKFCLKANFVDITHARNIVSARLWSQIVDTRADEDKASFMTNSPNNGAVDGFPIKLYLNGKFEGIYTWNIPKDAWMFGMDEDDANNCVLCAEQNNNGNNDLALGSEFRAECALDGSDWSVEVPDSATDSVKTGFNNLISFVMNATDEEFKANLGNYANVQSLLDYFVFMIVDCGNDSAGKNILMVTEDGGIIWYISAYDKDSTWGQDQQQSESATTVYPDDFHETNSLLWERMIKCFTEELKANYSRLRATVLSWQNIFDAFERFGDVIGEDLYAKDKNCGYTLPGTAWNSIDYIESWTKSRLEYTDSYFATLGEEPYTVTNNLTNASTSNSATEVIPSGSYSATITANGGYELESVIVTMGGEDITDTVYADGVITIPAVTGDVVITATTVEIEVVTYTITNNLTNVSNSNSVESVNEGSVYSATITPNSGYILGSVAVAMGGTDITSTAVSDGVISIASVTGDIVITAVGETLDIGDGDLYSLAEAITSTGSNGSGVNTGVKPNTSETPNITVIVDFQLSAAASYDKTIISATNHTSSTKGLQLSYTNNNLVVTMSYGYDITAIAVSDLERHQVALSMDRTNNILKIYVDGVLNRTVNNSTETVWLTENDYELCLLGDYYASTGTAWCPSATMYHCDVYTGILTDEQIIAKMNSYE